MFDFTKEKNRKYINDFFFYLLKKVNDDIILKHIEDLNSDKIFTKSDKNDYVTIYDKKTEEYLIKEINKKFISIKIIGEETTFQKNIDLSLIDDDYYFAIDPIDGTKNYINKDKNFCTMISLIFKKKPIACFIYYPLIKKYISSFKNFHSKILDLNTSKISTLKINKDLINLATGGTKGIPETTRKIILKKFNYNFKRCFIGSAGVETLMLANNEVDFIFHGRVTPWDHSPMSLIIKEASGEVLMFNNASTFNIFSKGPILASRDIKYWNYVKSKLNIN
ncbi:hypothetical protein OA253_00115 [Alphaproteobacteria bacterium]|nr:hypothetical protein [Alphaproteobacteria bacterium]